MFHDFFPDMGFIRYPMYVATLFMLIQVVRAAMQLTKPPASRSAMTTHTILIWGVLNALLGVLGTVLGMALAGGSIARAAAVEVTLVAAGLKISLYPTIFGLLLLTFAVVAWLVLQALQRRGEGQGAT
jgi:biopolymer transport protein ExbB/TolQ